jgi:hypothetical protein
MISLPHTGYSRFQGSQTLAPRGTDFRKRDPITQVTSFAIQSGHVCVATILQHPNLTPTR